MFDPHKWSEQNFEQSKTNQTGPTGWTNPVIINLPRGVSSALEKCAGGLLGDKCEDVLVYLVREGLVRLGIK